MIAAMPWIFVLCACDDRSPCHAGQDINVSNHGCRDINIGCICVSDFLDRVVVAVDHDRGHLNAAMPSEVSPSR
jgi:hypothetical protein